MKYFTISAFMGFVVGLLFSLLDVIKEPLPSCWGTPEGEQWQRVEVVNDDTLVIDGVKCRR